MQKCSNRVHRLRRASAEGWGGAGGCPAHFSLSLELAGTAANSALRRESQGSLNSSASLDLGFLAFVSSKSEVSDCEGDEMGTRATTQAPLCGRNHSQSPSPLRLLPLLPTANPSASLLSSYLHHIVPMHVMGAHRFQLMSMHVWVPR